MELKADLLGRGVPFAELIASSSSSSTPSSPPSTLPAVSKIKGRYRHSEISRTGALDASAPDEELVWTSDTVYWLRSEVVYRQYSFSTEPVSCAVFGRFTDPEAGPSSSGRSTGVYVPRASKTVNKLFGPFHTAQQAPYGSTGGSLKGKEKEQSVENETSLIIFLRTEAHIYVPTGDNIITPLPFAVERAWPLDNGGLLLQRMLDPVEQQATRQHGGNIVPSLHDRVQAAVADEVDDTPRLYTLARPFDEPKVVVWGSVQGGNNGEPGRITGPIGDVPSTSDILLVLGSPYNLVVFYDNPTSEIIFCRLTKVPLSSSLALAPTSRPLPAEDLPRDIRSTIAAAPGGRPSLHRNRSALDTRRSLGTDPLDRNIRRAPRPSKGAEAVSDLQAALDPSATMLAGGPPARAAGRSRITSAASMRSANLDLRRESGAAFIREDNDARPRRSLGKDQTFRDVMLQGIAERDLRETTMLMGLEQEERPRSELVLDKIFTWPLQHETWPGDLKVFVTDNLDSTTATINLLSSSASKLYRFQYQAYPSRSSVLITPEMQCECLAAVPIISTRPAVYDTLLLDETGNMQVLVGMGHLVPLRLPNMPRTPIDVSHKLAESLSMAVDPDDSMRSLDQDARVTAILASTQSSFYIQIDGGECYRLSASFIIRDRLARQLIEALSYVMPGDAFQRLHIAVLVRIQRHTGRFVIGHLLDLVRGICGVSSVRHPVHTGANARQSKNSIARRLEQLVHREAQGMERVSSAWPSLPVDTLPIDDIARILLVLHLVAQDCRLSLACEGDLLHLAPLLVDIAQHIHRPDWADYWIRLVPSARAEVFSEWTISASSILDRFEAPPDILNYLSRRLLVPLKPFPTPATCLGGPMTSSFGAPSPCRQTIRVIDIYNTLGIGAFGDSRPDRNLDLRNRAHETVHLIVSHGLDQTWLANLAPGVAMPILEMIRFSQGIPGSNWPSQAYRLIGRSDLAARHSSNDNKVLDKSGDARLDLEPAPEIGGITGSEGAGQTRRADDPSLPFVRFGQDRRVQEVERIMQISRVRTIVVEDPKGMNEADLHQHRQNMVNLYAHRTLSSPIGKGIFDYGTRSVIPPQRFEIPILELAVKIPPHPTAFNALIAPDMADWPCFHNGTAAALSVSPDAEGVDSTWISFNRPVTSTPEHAGFLLGLGLNGHLRKLSNVHIFENLNARHDYNSVGVLLGLACSYVGSQDQMITKTLSLHTRALLPLGSVELNASPIIQSSALVGLGLLYVGTKNLRMAEVALSEIARSEMPGVDTFNEHQEAYSFSAAMAFGLIMLGRGEQSFSQVEHRMVARLRSCISSEVGQVSTAASLPIDTTITSSGAALALGLMYLKSGRRDMADILEIPSSAFAAEHVRPDLLLMRTFSRCLIMWDEITPTPEWIQSSVPHFIRAAVLDPKKTASLDLENELAWFNVVAGACLAIGVKYAGTATEMAHTSLLLFFGVLNKAAIGQSATYEGKIRRTAARQALNVVMLAHAAVMSGTGELGILRRLRLMHGQEGAGIHYGTHMATTMACGILFMGRGHYTLGNSNLAVAAMSIAFFPRFLPGAGDNRAYPQAFRHLWALAAEPRCLIAKDVDTRETIYLPVKITLQEGGQRRQQLLISPTLVAPFDNIISIEVDSPRYWPIKLDLTDKKDRDLLTRTRTIYAKRKAVYMDYNSDPKGHRSINVRVGLLSGLDTAYDLLSPAAPPTISSGDLTELLRAHSGSPEIIQMAAVFSGTGETDKFVRNVLLECVGQDKLDCLTVYLTLWQWLHGQGELRLLHLAQIRMIQHFYRPAVSDGTYLAVASNGEKRQPMLRTGFIAALSRCMMDNNTGLTSVDRYYATGAWDDQALDVAVLLQKKQVPAGKLLQELKRRLGDTQADADPKDAYIAKVRRSAAIFDALCRRDYDLHDNDPQPTPGACEWSEDSLDSATSIWLGRKVT